MSGRARLMGLVLTIALASCAPRKDDGVTLRFWALGREGEVVKDLIPEFERANPRIRVDVQQIPFLNAHEKLLTACVGEVTPDIAQVGNTWIPELANLEAIAPLDDRVRHSAVVGQTDYFPGIWDTNVVGARGSPSSSCSSCCPSPPLCS